MPSRIPWSWGNLSEGENVPSYLNRVLSDLEQYLRLVHDELTYGPVAGSYLLVHLHSQETVGTALPDTTLDRFTFPFEAKPTLVQFYLLGGNATVDLQSGGSSVLGGTTALIGGTSVYFNSAGDFALTKVSGDLTLSKSSTDAATPHAVRCRVLLKNVSKVEPA